MSIETLSEMIGNTAGTVSQDGLCGYSSSLSRISFGRHLREGKEMAIKSQASDLATLKSEHIDIDPIGIYRLKVARKQYRDKITGEFKEEQTLISPDFNNEPIQVWTDAGEYGFGERKEWERIDKRARNLASTDGAISMFWVSPGKDNREEASHPPHRAYLWKKDGDMVTAYSYQLYGTRETLTNMMRRLGGGKDTDSRVEDQTLIIKGKSDFGNKHVYHAYRSSLSIQEKGLYEEFVRRFEKDVQVPDRERQQKIEAYKDTYESRLKEAYTSDIAVAFQSIVHGFLFLSNKDTQDVKEDEKRKNKGDANTESEITMILSAKPKTGALFQKENIQAEDRKPENTEERTGSRRITELFGSREQLLNRLFAVMSVVGRTASDKNGVNKAFTNILYGEDTMMEKPGKSTDKKVDNLPESNGQIRVEVSHRSYSNLTAASEDINISPAIECRVFPKQIFDFPDPYMRVFESTEREVRKGLLSYFSDVIPNNATGIIDRSVIDLLGNNFTEPEVMYTEDMVTAFAPGLEILFRILTEEETDDRISLDHDKKDDIEDEVDEKPLSDAIIILGQKVLVVFISHLNHENEISIEDKRYEAVVRIIALISLINKKDVTKAKRCFFSALLYREVKEAASRVLIEVDSFDDKLVDVESLGSTFRSYERLLNEFELVLLDDKTYSSRIQHPESGIIPDSCSLIFILACILGGVYLALKGEIISQLGFSTNAIFPHTDIGNISGNIGSINPDRYSISYPYPSTRRPRLVKTGMSGTLGLSVRGFRQYLKGTPSCRMESLRSIEYLSRIGFSKKMNNFDPTQKQSQKKKQLIFPLFKVIYQYRPLVIEDYI